jgi:2-polyprenyl-3-methyl-5-hydroxy-6-metoxy-1,4-benzoquinol methylase
VNSSLSVLSSTLCEICGSASWTPVFRGPVRDGAFGKVTKEHHVVWQCDVCLSQRLEEEACKDTSFYADTRYRCLVGDPTDAEGFWEKHDVLQMQNLQVLGPHLLRNKTVADIGCAAGSFLDHIKGLTRHCLSIDPCQEYHQSLKDRNYEVFSTVTEALSLWSGSVDYAFSFSVIEHILNPKEFLREIKELLKPDGYLLISTPNRRDILMELLGDEYKRFFYRSVHRWYFDEASLMHLTKVTGLEFVQLSCVHRFGVSNALTWLRDRSPQGDNSLPHLNDSILNDFWKRYLESKGVGDYLYLLLRRASGAGACSSA